MPYTKTAKPRNIGSKLPLYSFEIADPVFTRTMFCLLIIQKIMTFAFSPERDFPKNPDFYDSPNRACLKNPDFDRTGILQNFLFSK